MSNSYLKFLSNLQIYKNSLCFKKEFNMCPNKYIETVYRDIGRIIKQGRPNGRP